MIRIIVADDHAVVRAGLRDIFARTEDIEVAAEAANGDGLLAQLAHSPYDAVLLDMRMPGLSGAPLVRHIREHFPALPILVLSMHTQGQVAASAIRSGASGYVAKDSEPETIVAALRKVIGGRRFIDPALVDAVLFAVGPEHGIPTHERLSQRELQVCRMLLEGCNIAHMADTLGVSVKTIGTYKTRIFDKLQVRNLVELVRYAIEHGLTH